MQYEGQTYTLRIALDIDHLSIAALRDQLRQAFLDRFKIDLGGFRAKLINLRTSVTGVRRWAVDPQQAERLWEWSIGHSPGEGAPRHGT